MRIAILPARGGSKRLKNKNVAEFCGKPIIHYPLSAAKSSGLFDRIHVSTESPEIRRVVESLEFAVEFLRDPSLADDHTPIVPVLRWVLERYRERGLAFEDVCLILPCAPLIEAEDLRAAHEIYRSHGGRRNLMAVAPYPAPVEWAYTRDAEGLLTPCQPGMFAVRSQDLEKKYYDTGTFAFFRAEWILHAEPHAETNFVSYVLPRHKAVDIDDAEDLALAERLYRGRAATQAPPASGATAPSR